MANEFSLLKCSNIGCRETFKWREQLRCHKTKCSFTPKEVAVKYKRLQDGTFQCETRYQPFTKQSQHFIPSQAVDGPTHSQSPVSFDIVSEVEVCFL